jgi:osmotically-inducible protein OsmY
MKNSNRIVLVSLLLLSLSGCAAAFLPVAAGIVAFEERSIGTKADDNVIIAKIKAEFAKSDDVHLLSKISVNTYEGRVMLTGTLQSQAQVGEAVRRAWSVQGVREVINDLVVAPTPKNKAKDLWISTKLKTLFMVEENFNSVNYKYDVSDMVVYLIGVAQDQRELDTALKIASEVDGVERVVTHVLLKTDRRRAK